MKNLVLIFLEGAYTNLKRILFASDRVTDMEVRNMILEGRVTPTEKVAKVSCIGCGGCSNVCPTEAIEMVDLDEPVELMEGLVKTQLPVLHSERCVTVIIAMISVQYMHCLERQEPYILMMLVKSNPTYQN